jgi:formyltetrahydrofolate synthetase
MHLKFNLHLTGDIHAVTAANNLLGHLYLLVGRVLAHIMTQLLLSTHACSMRLRKATRSISDYGIAFLY